MAEIQSNAGFGMRRIRLYGSPLRKTIFCLFLLQLGLACSVSRADISVPFQSIATSPGPELSSPCTDNFALESPGTLVFRWRPVFPAGIKHYVFKLYRGYQVANKLIREQELPAGSYSFPLSARQFSIGQVYTWELIGVFLDGRKTDASFCSFQIRNE